MAQPSLGSVAQDYLELGRTIGSLSESRCGFCHVKQFMPISALGH
jgi:hypothetical protein